MRDERSEANGAARPSGDAATIRRPASGLLLVFGVAFAAASWNLGVAFKFDDLSQIPAAGALLADEAGAGDHPEILATFPNRRTVFFRPLLWATLSLENAVLRPPLKPFPFHLTSLALHAAGAVVVLLALRRIVPEGAALAGALFFGVQSSGLLAVSWIAARSDLLAGLCGALAVLFALRAREGGLLNAALCGASAAGAILSKQTGYCSAALASTVFLATALRGSMRISKTAVFAIPLAAAVAWQQACAGKVGLVWHAQSPFDAGVLREAYAQVFRVLEHLLVPWREGSLADDASPWLYGFLSSPGLDARRLCGLVGWLLLVLFSLCSQPKPVLAAIESFGALIVTTIPAAMIWVASSGDGTDHALYASVFWVAAIVGCAASGAMDLWRRKGPGIRLLVLVAAAVFGAIVLDAHVSIARTELAASRSSRLQIEIVEELAARSTPETAFVLCDCSRSGHGAQKAAHMGPRLFAPPFRRESLRVLYVSARDILLANGFLASEPSEIRVVEDDGDAGFIVWPPIPALPAALPDLVRASDGEGRWLPRAAMPPRAALAVDVALEPGPAAALELEMIIDGRSFTRRIPVPECALPSTERLTLPRVAEALVGASLESLRLRADKPERLAKAPPVLGKELRTLEARLPKDGFSWSPGDPPWLFSFIPSSGATRFVMSFEVPSISGASSTVDYEFGRDAMIPGSSGEFCYFPRETERKRREGADLGLADIPALVAKYRRPFGLDDLLLRWSVGEVDPVSGDVLARTPWRSLVYRDRR